MSDYVYEGNVGIKIRYTTHHLVQSRQFRLIVDVGGLLVRHVLSLVQEPHSGLS